MSENNEFGAFQDTRLLYGGLDFAIYNGLDKIVFQGRIEIERNRSGRNTLRDLIYVLTNIRDAIPETVETNSQSADVADVIAKIAIEKAKGNPPR